jgi:hypothetical protein
LPYACENVLTGEKYTQGKRVDLEPYGVLIAKKI